MAAFIAVFLRIAFCNGTWVTCLLRPHGRSDHSTQSSRIPAKSGLLHLTIVFLFQHDLPRARRSAFVLLHRNDDWIMCPATARESIASRLSGVLTKWNLSGSKWRIATETSDALDAGDFFVMRLFEKATSLAGATALNAL